MGWLGINDLEQGCLDLSGLSQAQRDLLMEVGLEFEVNSEATGATFQAYLKKTKAWMASEGMETITFKGADRTKWLSAASTAGWAEVIERSPEHGPALKKLFTK